MKIMLDDAKAQIASGTTFKAILLPGDLCAHNLGVKQGAAENNWDGTLGNNGVM